MQLGLPGPIEVEMEGGITVQEVLARGRNVDGEARQEMRKGFRERRRRFSASESESRVVPAKAFCEDERQREPHGQLGRRWMLERRDASN